MLPRARLEGKIANDEWDEFPFSDDEQRTQLDAKGLAALGASLFASALALSGGLCFLMSMPGLLQAGHRPPI